MTQESGFPREFVWIPFMTPSSGQNRNRDTHQIRPRTNKERICMSNKTSKQIMLCSASLLMCLAILCSSIWSSIAGDNIWTTTGPYGGRMGALAIIPPIDNAFLRRPTMAQPRSLAQRTAGKVGRQKVERWIVAGEQCSLPSTQTTQMSYSLRQVVGFTEARMVEKTGCK